MSVQPRSSCSCCRRPLDPGEVCERCRTAVYCQVCGLTIKCLCGTPPKCNCPVADPGFGDGEHA